MPDKVTGVPFADLHLQYLSVQAEVDAAIAEVIATSAYIRGPHVESFEEAFANAIGVSHCVSCGNGTDALYIAMVAMGLSPGDEVIVPAMSWISTSETVTQAGGKVIFCDIDPFTYTLSPENLREKITSRTVGIIPVHLYGHPANMGEITKIAEINRLWVLEDCAQAHLAKFEGQTVGTFGNAATFSFYPGKNLGAMGDAGAIVTNDKALAERMAKYARHGGLRKGEHEVEGINSRMDGLQAAVLGVKLKHLPEWTARRRVLAKEYSQELAKSLTISSPQESSWAYHAWHLYVIQTDNRKEFVERLRAADIQTSINYPCALPFLPCYKDLGHHAEDFPVSHSLAQRCLALPLFAELSEVQQRYVVQVICAQ